MKKVLFSSVLIAAMFVGCGGSNSCCDANANNNQTLGNKIPPVAAISGLANSTVIEAGQSVSVNGTSSSDRDGNVVSYHWMVDGVAATTTAVNPTFTFDTAGEHQICLTVTDNDNLDSANVECRTLTVNSVAAAPVTPTAVITLTDSDRPLHIFTDHTFSCADSYDNDTIGTNPQIVKCDWNIQSFYEDGVTPYRDCSATDTFNHQVHICGSVGKIVATLTVTDNDGQTNTTTKVYTNFSR